MILICSDVADENVKVIQHGMDNSIDYNLVPMKLKIFVNDLKHKVKSLTFKNMMIEHELNERYQEYRIKYAQPLVDRINELEEYIVYLEGKQDDEYDGYNECNEAMNGTESPQWKQSTDLVQYKCCLCNKMKHEHEYSIRQLSQKSIYIMKCKLCLIPCKCCKCKKWKTMSDFNRSQWHYTYDGMRICKMCY